MRSLARTSVCTLLLAALPAASAADPTDLSITRIALFSSGVGYFECDAKMSGNATAELKFRTDQVNDVLKSMVLQDFGGGKIGIVSYASKDPIEKALKSFAVDLTGKPTLYQLLDQLRGEPVEISGARTVKGTIVGVEKAQIIKPDGQTVQEVERVTVLTGTGLEQVELTQIQNIKLLESKIGDELNKALAVLATGHDADKKSVVLSFEGQGERQVRAAYLLEAPIWKTSYRLVLGEKKKPFIQGWAQVDNETENDWKDVRLSLISGRPISFRMDLYTPLYVPRPLEQLELYASLRPPTYEGNIAGKPEDHEAVASEKGVAMAKRPARSSRGQAEAPPPASPAGALMITGAATEELKQLELAGAGVSSLATAMEAGELFAYHIDTPVSVPRQHSAMLPIVNEAVEAEKVSIFNVATHKKYPLNGLELTNSTKLHLMQGPVTVFDDNVYAGDAKLPDLNPGEKRLVAYALDLSTEVLIKQQFPDSIVSLRIAKGILWHRHKLVDERQYDIKNKTDKDRTVLIEQAYTPDWKLEEPAKPYEETQNLLRFKVAVPGGKTVAQVIRLGKVTDQSVSLGKAGLDEIRFHLQSPKITPKLKEAIEKVIALRGELDDIARDRQQLEQNRKSRADDQARVRENLKVLDRQSDAGQEQVKKLTELDKQLDALGDSIAKATDTEKQKRKALQDYLLSLDIE